MNLFGSLTSLSSVPLIDRVESMRRQRQQQQQQQPVEAVALQQHGLAFHSESAPMWMMRLPTVPAGGSRGGGGTAPSATRPPVGTWAAASAHENPTLGTYLKFALAGAICCSATHSAVVPIDVVKTRLQLSDRYHGMTHAARTIVKEEGAGALLTGLGPTTVGYFLQGWFKFGLYEYFKRLYSEMAGSERAERARFGIWLAAGGTAEFFADLALCPMEATRIRLVSKPDFAPSLSTAFTKILTGEGLRGFYAGLLPILLKQIPYTMAKFAVFETSSEAIYRSLASMGKPKSELSDPTKLMVSLNSGIFAGLVAAVVSQPADTVLSVINKHQVSGSIAQATVRIIRELGFRGLFRGLGTRAIMVGSLTAGQFFIYDGIKQLFGVAPPAKKEVPAMAADFATVQQSQ